MRPILRIVSTSLLIVALSACSEPPGSRKPVVEASAPAAAVARGKIDVENGLLNIVPQVGAIVNTVNVKAGDTVRKGQVLAKLDTQSAQINVATARAQLQQAQAQLNAQTARLPAMKKLAERWQKAAKAGAAEQQKADDAQEAQQQLESDIAVAKAAVELARQKQNQAEHELTLYTLLAPQDAEVIRVQTQTGSNVSADGKSVFVLLPAQPLIVRAEVNESFIARIQPGMQAEVVPETSAQAVALKAKVVRVGKVFEQSRLGDEVQDRTSRVVECILVFDPAQSEVQHLRLGQNMLVRFQ